jgi:hypothetical protein
MSPKHAGPHEVFGELVSFPQLIGHESLELDVVVIAEETVWRYDGPKRWRRRGWVTVERRLLDVYETISLRCGADYAAMLPPGLPAEFVTADLAKELRCTRHVAQKVAYCLREGGLAEKVGSRGNAIVYASVPRDIGPRDV